MFFLMKKLKGVILSQNHRRSQGGGLSFQAQNLAKKALFLHFHFFLASVRPTVINNK